MKKLFYGILLPVLFLYVGCEQEKIDVAKYGMVSGTVLDGEDYTPLSGVQIITNPASSSILTNDSGYFEINKISVGEVAITARKMDFLSTSLSIAVYENEKTEIVFYLLEDDGDVGWVQIYDPVPGNGAVDQNTSFTFQWSVDQEYKDRELEYSVYYYVSNSTTQQIAGENLSIKEVTVSGLENSTTYYWYVVAKYDGSRVANSPTWTFKTAD